MKYKQLTLLFIVFVIMIFSHTHETVWAQTIGVSEQESPIIKVAFSDDLSIVTERMLYTALKRIGYQMVAKATGMRTAVADVNYGDAAILPIQTDGWDIRYPNLIKVPVAIDNVEFTVYTRSDEPYEFSAWGDMAGIRLGYRWQNEFITNNIWRANASRYVVVNDIDELWFSLIDGAVDAIILPRLSQFEHKFPQGIKRAGVIERQPVYTYVNNRYAYLVPLLEKTYQEMIADGTIDFIRSGRTSFNEKPIILHLNSFNAQNEWERSQMESIRRNLETETAVEYYSIHLNSNEPHSQTSFNNVISEMIRTEFIVRNPNLIIASGNEVFEFVLNNYYLLFPNIPVLFFGVQGFDKSILHGLEENVTGIFEEILFYENVSEMLRLFPDTRRIFILTGSAHSWSIKVRNDIENKINFFQAELHNLPVEFVFCEEKPLSGILDDIRGFGSDTLVLIGSYFSDSDGIFYSEAEIQKLVCQASENPVFCLSSSYIGHGTFGGLFSSTALKSNVIASMAAEILKGTPLNDIPVITDSAFLNQWQFDYQTAKSFKIKNLPKGSVFINRAPLIWETNPLEFKLALTIATLFSLIIIGLIIFYNKNRKMTQYLHQTAVQLEIAATEASSANKAKSNFLANMSHEIRTPMNAILGIAETLLRDESHSPDTHDAYRKIYESGSLLLNIINDILDISKIEAGKLELVPVKYDIPSLINDTAQLSRLRYDSKPIEFTINVDENTPYYLFGDELRIKQVVSNILSNAFKYTDEGSVEFFINAEQADINDSENVTLVFRMRDTGQGMTEEQIMRLGDKYIRFNAEANYETVGTGLGMSITKHLLKMMNGEISIKSEPGKGSEFTVYIPQKRIGSDICGSDVAEKLKNFTFRSTTLMNKTQFIREYMPYGSVLVVDDVESNIYVAKGMLSPYGLKIDSASSGFEAINKIEDGMKYDIVFMDHMMPKMDGIETVKRLRNMGYNSTIIALTANALIGRAEMFLQNGFDGYIAKPIDSREMNYYLNEFIRNKKPPEVVEAAQREQQEKKKKDAGIISAHHAAQKESLDSELMMAVVNDIENALSVLDKLLPEIKAGDNDLTLYTTIVHGMKSALANIGETQLSESALRLEQAGNNSEIISILNEAPEYIKTLKSFLEKTKRPETDYNRELSRDDMDLLQDKLKEIKTTCGNLMPKDAKKALNELKQKTWPIKINDYINEISLHLLRGEYSKAVSAADEAANFSIGN